MRSRAADEWCKEVAPSNELRHWYEHDPAKLAEFTERYVFAGRCPADDQLKGKH